MKVAPEGYTWDSHAIAIHHSRPKPKSHQSRTPKSRKSRRAKKTSHKTSHVDWKTKTAHKIVSPIIQIFQKTTKQNKKPNTACWIGHPRFTTKIACHSWHTNDAKSKRFNAQHKFRLFFLDSSRSCFWSSTSVNQAQQLGKYTCGVCDSFSLAG